MIHFKQIDAAYAAHPYTYRGATPTVGSSGCGPASMAIILSHFRPKLGTDPVKEADWCLQHGFKATINGKDRGTYYGFAPKRCHEQQLSCVALCASNHYHKEWQRLHAEVTKQVQHRHAMVLCCVGPSRWTHGGHFVVVYQCSRSLVCISDPASYKRERQYATPQEFFWAVKYAWAVVDPSRPPDKKEEKDLTENQTMELIRKYHKKMLPEVFHSLDEIQKKADWAAPHVQRCLEAGIIQGTGDGDLSLTFQDLRYLTALDRFAKKLEQ